MDEMQRAYDASTKTTAVLDGMPHGSSVSSKVENGVLEYESAKEAYEKAKAELHRLRLFINHETLDTVLDTDMQYKIIRMRYRSNRRVRSIAKELKITERHCYRIMNHAEKLIGKAPDSEEYHEFIAGGGKT